MNRLSALVIAFVLALTMVAAPVAVAPEQNAAAASDCRVQYVLCGRVTNHPLSHTSIYATYNWSRPWSSTSLVSPGRSSSSVRDADGYFIRRGYKGWEVSRYSGARISDVYYGPRWVKFRDYESPLVKVRRR